MLKKLRFIFFVSLSLGFLFLGNNSVLGNTDEEVTKLIVGETKAISVRTPSRVVIGNPAVADIGEVTNSEITVSAKAAGTTTLVFWDVFGEQSIKIRVVAEDMSEIKRRVDNILSSLNLSGVYTQAVDEESKVILLGNVKTPQDIERVNTALATLKDKIIDLLVVKEEEAVVDIDVQVLELSKDATDTLGFTWPGSVTISTDQPAGSTYTGTTPSGWSTFFKITNWSRMPFAFKLDMLVQEGKARVLSRPRLACQSGKEAQLLVGGEKPTFTTSTTEGGTVSSTVEYKEYGIKLKIRPTVAQEKRIKLGVDVEVSEVGTAETIGSATVTTGRAYPLTKRTASTELYINDGETISIGGLIKQKTEEDLRKVPWLADVPVLGLFFRQKTTRVGGGQGERGNTELFIALTPTIVSEKKELAPAEKQIKPEIVSPAIVEDTSTPETGYARLIQKRILENLTYPRPAKEAGFQGAVRLKLRLSYRGELLEAMVKDSSGYQVLDENAVSAAKNISSYPPFPSSIDQQELWIEVPIVYRLD